MQIITGTVENPNLTGGRGGHLHITMFKVDGQHVEFRSSGPAPISEGERVTVVGEADPGLTRAYALRNDSTGWVSPVSQGVGIVAFFPIFTVVAVIFGIGFAVFGFSVFPPFGIFALFAIGVWVWLPWKIAKPVKEAHRRSVEAHRILESGGGANRPA